MYAQLWQLPICEIICQSRCAPTHRNTYLAPTHIDTHRYVYLHIGVSIRLF